jgi:nicotinamide-nucleotide amidase
LYNEEEAIMIATSIIQHCIEQRVTISAAESCTGGQLIAALVAVPGASSVIEASFVTYANEAKIKYAHVKPQTIQTYGAVSEETACEMAAGVAQEANADIGIGITGIAGPSGGTKDKPVGTVFVSVDVKGNTTSRRYLFEGNRYQVQSQTVNAVLALLGEVLL